MRFFRFYNPEIFQGNMRLRGYFEGWYYKHQNKDKSYALSIIPGISNAKGKPHCFIQFIDSRHEQSAYIEYPLHSFHAAEKALWVQIDNSIFTQDKVHLDVDKNGWHVHGDLSFYDIIPFPKTAFMRGIMGPFCFIPRMECNHGIVNIRHTIKGSLEVNGRHEVFDEGTGYIEKDWGTSFPTGYIWMQSHDLNKNTTFMFSVADIPFLGRRFLGILCFLYIDGKYISLSTYSGAKMREYKLEKDRAAFTLSNHKYNVSIDIKKAQGSSLQAPAKGLMERTIEETLNATATIDFLQANKKPLYQGTLSNAGLEICGDVQSMLYNYLKF